MVAKDGVKSLELIKKANADVILLDLQMPKVDGFEVTQKLRTDKAYSKDLKIIIFSNLDKDSSIEKLKKCGHIDAFLVKTAFTPTEMVDEVNRILNV